MATQKIPFEALTIGFETTPGTPAVPTHYLPFEGMLKSTDSWYEPGQSTGTLAEVNQSVPVRFGGEWEGEGGLDIRMAPFLFNLFVAGNIASPTTPAGATTARLFTFNPNRKADDLEIATIYFGDENMDNVLQGAYGAGTELTISGDSSSEDGVSLKASGICKKPEPVAPPTMPTLVQGALLKPMDMQMWLDFGSTAIGTTDVTERFVKNEVTLRTGMTPLYGAKGPGSDASFRSLGRDKTRPDGSFAIEADNTMYTREWANYIAGQRAKIRYRWNGLYIEDISSTPAFAYVQLDLYCTLREPDWDELENIARLIQFNTAGHYEASIASEFNVKVLTTATAL